MSMRAIKSYSYEDQGRLMVNLTRAIRRSGGELLREEPLSEHAFGLDVELPLTRIVELYGELVRYGLEFSRSGQSALAELCTVQKHVRLQPACDLVHLRLEVSLLQGVSLESLLAGRGPVA
ncbi:hypothetical protein [Terriglobus tenax]|uniref:hypothetical protein n=1 Tax=Terriglobus tenax TaxID=1111115 RepID=UPI0021DF99B0|nr:hypothetical protein [Terriglobus tenax]